MTTKKLKKAKVFDLSKYSQAEIFGILRNLMNYKKITISVKKSK